MSNDPREQLRLMLQLFSEQNALMREQIDLMGALMHGQNDALLPRLQNTRRQLNAPKPALEQLCPHCAEWGVTDGAGRCPHCERLLG